MRIEAYGIKLVRLTEEYLELVRYWRNNPRIRSFMEYREYITRSMQRKWFGSINNGNNNYFVIFVNSKAIGLISGSEIDWELGVTNNGGIFIWEPAYYETDYPAKAAILLTDISFWLGMKKTYIKILSDNYKSIGFNKLLGYTICEGQEGKYNQSYELSKNRYFDCVEKIRKSIGAEGIVKVFVKSDSPAYLIHLANLGKSETNPYKSKFAITIY